MKLLKKYKTNVFRLLTFIEKVNIILQEEEQNRVWCTANFAKGGGAYVIRTSLLTLHIYTIY